MSERSLPPLGHANPLAGSERRNRHAGGRTLGRAIRSAFGKLAGLFGRRRRSAGVASAPADAALASKAGTVISEHAAAHSALFERAARLAEKAARLDAEGTPSESARNRAERAGEEAWISLAGPRAAFEGSFGDAGRRTFDAEAGRRFPFLGSYLG